MTALEKAAEIIREFEGESLTVYADPIGLPTVGVGHLVQPEDNLKIGDKITKEQSEAFLREDMRAAFNRVRDFLGKLEFHTNDLSDDQMAALISLSLNLGNAPFVKGTGIWRAFEENRFEDVPEQFKRWRKAGGRVLPGLIRRREAEARLFQGQDWREPPPAVARVLTSDADIRAALLELGYQSPHVRGAILVFQMDHELVADAIAGPKTKAAIRAELAKKGGA